MLLDPNKPWLSLDLAGNGGLLAPKSLDELDAWLEHETSFWSWLRNSRVDGHHDQVLQLAVARLDTARSVSAQTLPHRFSGPENCEEQLSQIQENLEEAFVRLRLPHSSTPVAKRIEIYRRGVGDDAASFFASVFVPPEASAFQPQKFAEWRGLIEGLIERYALISAPASGQKKAAEQSFEQLRKKIEALHGDKTVALDELHRNYKDLAASVITEAEQQKADFAATQAKQYADFEKLVDEHKQGMESLRKTFREEIALRAPADYWDDKRKKHDRLSKLTGGISFAGILIAGVGLSWLVHDLLRSTVPGVAPEAWQAAMPVVVGLFTIWGVRLVVRMFLSHLHLETDAAERVVMARTYLSLLEGDRLASKEDRQLILQALFRPTSDGLVKDEGIPPSMLEFLTRQTKG